MDEIETLPNGSVSIKFEMVQGEYKYIDAIVVTADAFAKMSQADIDAEKQLRFDNWLEVVTAGDQ